MQFSDNHTEDLIPDGTYAAILVEVFDYRNERGQRHGFRFVIQNPKLLGRSITRTVAASRGTKSRLVETIRALNQGTMLFPEDFKTLVGTRCLLLVTQQTSRQGVTFSAVEKIFYGAKI